MNGAVSPLCLFVFVECIGITSSFYVCLVCLKSSYKKYYGRTEFYVVDKRKTQIPAEILTSID
jgi:hypothetical protein